MKKIFLKTVIQCIHFHHNYFIIDHTFLKPIGLLIFFVMNFKITYYEKDPFDGKYSGYYGFIVSCSGDNDSADSGNSTSTTGGGASDNAVGTTGAASVAATDVTACGSVTGVSKIVCLTEQLKATLTSSQLAALQLDYTYANIKTWSNLPAAMSARKGIPLGNLNATQVGIAKAIIKEMSGTTANEGYDEIQQLLYADNYLNANGGGSTYGSGNFYLAFFGTPSATGKFEIMFTGHHKTIANTYNNGALVAATPLFTATEPLSFAVNSTTYAPVDQEKNAIVALLGALSSTACHCKSQYNVYGSRLRT
jgi:hypothetical protein